ncbi:MAG: Ppx/GppA family phosphatase [Acidaminococcales bacterium]|nr:Ppx/GppA family phosphatase [Acidaminococcales bacterium]
MQRVGIIDLGSNAARLVILHIHKDNSHHLIYAQRSSLRLSQRINKNGEITADAVKDILDAIQKFRHMCTLLQTTKVIGAATAAVRNAKNGNEIIARIKKETGLELDIISGETEAYYGYLGVINTIDEKNAILFDLGGGSIEIVLIRDRRAEHLVSLNLGTTNMTEKFKISDKMSSKNFREITAYIGQKMRKSFPWLKNSKLPIIGIGGTVRNVAKIYQRRVNYSYPKLHNYRLSSTQFNEVFNLLRNTNCEQRKKIPGLNSERADIILAGVTIINTLISIAKSKEFIISGCGLREGLFYDYYLHQLGRPVIIENILKESVENLMTFTVGRAAHSHKVSRLSEKMFTAWKPLHKLSDDDFKVLYIASALHDLGISINYYFHPRHSAYLIENAPLMGVTHREQIMAALVANWHNSISMKNLQRGIYKDFLSEKDIITARKLAVILAMAENLDFTETNAVKDISPDILADGRAVLGVAMNESLRIELDELSGNLDLFKKEFKTELVIRTSF